MSGRICELIYSMLGRDIDEGYSSRTENLLRPECDVTVPENALVINFINTFSEVAASLSAITGLPADFILGWSAAEVGWNFTNSRAATENNNWFNLTAPDAASTGGWEGAVACASPEWGLDYWSGMACFIAVGVREAFFLSGRAAMLSQNGRYLAAALGVLQAGGNYAEAAQAIAAAGFDPGRTDYGRHFQGTWEAIRRRLDCSAIEPPSATPWWERQP